MSYKNEIIEKINLKLKELNCDVILIDLLYKNRIGSGRNFFNVALFSNGIKLNLKSFTKFKTKLFLLYPELIIQQYLSKDEILRIEAEKLRKHLIAKIGGNATAKSSNRCFDKKGEIPWNKGKKSDVVPWNKGLTKETDIRLEKISNERLGEKNPMYGRTHSDEWKKAKSCEMKQKIQNGEWTPNPHNSRTRKNIEFRSIKFRSSWEVIFYAATGYEYEKIRIPYISETGKLKIYITDFFNKDTLTIFEIKPSKNIKKDNFKISEGIKWAKDNNYKFEIITENELINLISYDDLPHNEIDNVTLLKIKNFYETTIKKRNRQTGNSL